MCLAGGKSGQSITIEHKDGNKDFIDLPNDSPFAIVSTLIHNSGQESSIINKVTGLHATVDLGRPTDQLKILGTGGLSKPGKRIGSYMWLAAAEPESRNGIVAGWVTTDRGSGVVFAESKEKISKSTRSSNMAT